MVHPSQRTALYPPRKPAWCLTVRKGETVRNYRIRPALVGSAAGVLVLFLAVYVGATAYLIFRDDLVGAAVSRQVRMQYAYEERIAALRAELDRLTSRHAVQTEGVEQQLTNLLDQQALIDQRQSSLDALVDKARAAGIALGDKPPLPQARPSATPEPAAHPDAPGDSDSDGGVQPLGYEPTEPAGGDVISRTLFRHGKPAKPIALDGNVRPTLARVAASLDRTESAQSSALDALDTAAIEKSDRLSRTLTGLGAKVNMGTENGPEGGPFVPAEGLHFVERVALLNRTLDGIDTLRETARAMPLGVPVHALYLSSPFGYRVDPFLKRPAFHSGLDFAADAGSIVHATAPGKVVSAGWNGGYGQMVEIAHADGLSTRYGHLSEILVTPGMQVDAGTPIGRVGTTGRSTGPHLHYETRRNGEAVDPAIYLAAGKALSDVE